MITSLNDYKKKNGDIDWDAYRKAQVRNGESCCDCGKFIIFGNGYPQQCGECKALERDSDSVVHNSKVRCPHCRDTMDVEDLYMEGSHDIYCVHCDQEFTVITHISFSFESPALKKEEG